MDETVTNTKFRMEKVAPEGGWGYLIGIGLALPFACCLGALGSFGLMFNEFLTNLGAGTSAVTIVNGAFFSALSFASLFSSTLFRQFSMRSVGVFGSLVYFAGSLMTIFVTSVEHLIVSFGVLQGAGIGFMAPVGYTIFNHYFVRKRVFMMGIMQALKGIGIMGYPIMVQFLMERYGFRGTMAVIAAINAHAILGMLAMHPIEWHYKVIKVPVDEDEPLMDPNANINEVKVNMISEDGEYEFNQTKLEKPNEVKSPRVKKLSLILNSSAREEVYRKLERSKSLDPTQKIDFDYVRTRVSSIMSLGDMGGDAMVIETFERTKNGRLKKVIDFLDLTLFKDLVYVNMVLGVSFGLYSDNAFFTLLPLYLFELNFPKPDTAMIVATGAAADMTSRVFLAIMSLFIEIKARNLFWAGAIGIILLRFVFLNMTSFSGMIVIVAILGFLRTWLHVPISLIFAEYLPKERFPTGYSLFMFFQGNFAFLVGPFIGYVRDVTKSYIICFNSLTFIMSLCAIPWLLEAIWLRMHPQRIDDNDESTCDRN
ncbi:monocarboxylate transporter 14-like [Sitodiplosis mosellana]|uniref:monocarboxylate transporter 14-like n=1 Tax=Sitodiplosis mosellana TaxID=263140 RepID=UPI002443C82C|nr:monocarboxylate transporter 14-like [Sitodiplosis mosellana]